MTKSFRIGRIYGIDIEIDYTWFIIFALLALLLSRPGGPLTKNLPDLPLVARWLLALVATLLFFGSVLLHELSHSLVALRNGLKISGITLFIFGGVSKMTDEPRSPGVEFRMAIAGPAASFVLAAVFFALSRLVDAGPAHVFGTVFLWLAVVNAMLGAFNLLPGFPLDGGRVLRAGLWQWFSNLGEATRIASAFGQGLGTLMIVGGVFLALIRDISGLWLAFIGWFLIQAAQSSYQQVLVRQLLSDVIVGDVMTRDVDTVPADCTLEEVVHEHVMMRSHPAYPVFDNGHLLGLLTLGDIRHVPREQRYHVTAREVVPPLSEAQTITPDAEVWDALGKMMTGNQGRLLVVDDGHLAGIISRSDILRVMRTRMELGG
jgi:Zn-dependent protease/CBS domain-containing protein